MEETKELIAALVAAQKSATAIAKASKNTHHRYAYTSAEDLIDAGRKMLTKNNLSLMTVGWDVIPQDVPDSPVKLRIHYSLVHTSGQYLNFSSEASVLPISGRGLDKSEMSTLTANLGYTIRGLLQLKRGDDENSIDARDDRNHVPSKPAVAPEHQAIVDAVMAVTTKADLDKQIADVKTKGLTGISAIRTAIQSKIASLK